MHLAQRRLLAGSCSLLVALIMAGCGGSSNSSSSPSTTYVASYTGNYEDINTSPPSWGTITFTVTAASTTTSTVNGTLTGTSPGSTAEESITGTVSSAGVVSFNPILGGGFYTSAAGAFGPAGGKTLYGTLTAPVGGSNHTIYITTVVNPTATINVPTGDYSGTVVNDSNSMTGIVSLNVAAYNGTNYPVTGCEVSDDNGTPTLATISGTLSTSNGIAYSVTSTTGSGITSVSGTVTPSGSGITGTSLMNTETTPAQLNLNAAFIP
jgi:hypothetical protein